MKNLNKVADTITDLYDNRQKTGRTAAEIFQLVKYFINNSVGYTLHEKSQLEIFNVECFEAIKGDNTYNTSKKLIKEE